MNYKLTFRKDQEKKAGNLALPAIQNPELSTQPAASEIELQGKLNDPGITRLGDLTEVIVESEVIRIEELGMIERIKQLCPEFQGFTFCEAEGPPESQVEVVAARSAEDVSTGITESKRRIVATECGGVEVEVAVAYRSRQTVSGRRIEAVQGLRREGLQRPDSVGSLQESVFAAGA